VQVVPVVQVVQVVQAVLALQLLAQLMPVFLSSPPTTPLVQTARAELVTTDRLTLAAQVALTVAAATTEQSTLASLVAHSTPL
jgi:hypothetical protein